MSKEIKVITLPEITFDVAIEGVQKLVDESKKAVIGEIKDKASYNLAHEKQMMLAKQIRIPLDKREKELIQNANKQANEYKDSVKKFTSSFREIVEPEESRLKQLKADWDEKVRLEKEEEERKRQELINNRINELAEYNHVADIRVLTLFSDSEYNSLLEKVKVEYEAEKARLEAEEKAREEEAERIEKQRIENERIQKEQEAKEKELTDREAKIEADKKAIEDAKLAEQKKNDDAKAEKKRLDELEKAKKEAAKQAVIDAENKRKADAEKAEKKRAREEALKPDKEKLINIITQIESIIKIEVKDAHSIDLLRGFSMSISDVCKNYKKQVEELD